MRSTKGKKGTCSHECCRLILLEKPGQIGFHLASAPIHIAITTTASSKDTLICHHDPHPQSKPCLPSPALSHCQSGISNRIIHSRKTSNSTHAISLMMLETINPYQVANRYHVASTKVFCDIAG